MDMCFELAAQIMARLADSVTARRRGARLPLLRRPRPDRLRRRHREPARVPRAWRRRIVGDEDPAFAGGSYVMVQKYLHDLPTWHKLTDRDPGRHHRPHQARRHRAGRRGQADVRPQRADQRWSKTARRSRSCATTCRSATSAAATPGTYFIAYARSPRPIEQMLENMVIGGPPGNYDRLLDFTHPVTGTNFFAPSVQFLRRAGLRPEPDQRAAGRGHRIRSRSARVAGERAAHSTSVVSKESRRHE